MDCTSESAEAEIMTSVWHNVLIAQTGIPEFTHRNRRPCKHKDVIWLDLASVTVCLFSSSSSSVTLAAAIRDIRFTWTRFLSCRRSAIRPALKGLCCPLSPFRIVPPHASGGPPRQTRNSLCHFWYPVYLVFDRASINSASFPSVSCPIGVKQVSTAHLTLCDCARVCQLLYNHSFVSFTAVACLTPAVHKTLDRQLIWKVAKSHYVDQIWWRQMSCVPCSLARKTPRW